MSFKTLDQKAVCLITACLDAVGIPYSSKFLKESLVLVQSKAGDESIIAVVVSKSETPPEDRFEVLASEILSSNRETANRAFHAITEVAGYGSKTAIHRGTAAPIPEGRKTNRPYGDDHDRVIFRETVFRMVANPTSAVYKQLDEVIMTCVRFFFHKNEDLCIRLGFEPGDLKTYAQMWTANFWSTGRVVDPKPSENERLLYQFLRQRFAEFHTQMKDKRFRNIIVDRSSLAASLNIKFVADADSGYDGDSAGAPYGEGKAVLVSEEMDEEDTAEFERYKARHGQLDTSTDKKRRVSASALLAKSLDELPHDVMIETLSDAIENRQICPDARKEAVKQLHQHQFYDCKCKARGKFNLECAKCHGSGVIPNCHLCVPPAPLPTELPALEGLEVLHEAE